MFLKDRDFSSVISTLFVLVLLAISAVAQDVSASGSFGVFANPNQSSGNRFNNVGLHADLNAHINRLTLGGSVDGADSNSSRAFYHATYSVPVGEFVFHLGGGFHTFGQLTRGFGHLGADYERFAGFVRVGSEDTVHVEARYRIAEFAGGRVSLWPVYNYYHTDLGFRRDVDIHSIGLRIGLSSKGK